MVDYTAPAMLKAKPRHYTLALDGTKQRLTLAKDVDGVQFDSGGTVNLWADELEFQNSNDSTDKVFIAYKESGAPTNLDKTTAMIDLAPGQGERYPRAGFNKLRGDQINVRYLWAKGTAGDYLHFIIPSRG